jgi:hypothetical protein
MGLVTNLPRCGGLGGEPWPVNFDFNKACLRYAEDAADQEGECYDRYLKQFESHLVYLFNYFPLNSGM